MKNSKVILCSGGIGSGKSCIVKAFESLGVPSYDCDSAAKRLYDQDGELLEEIVSIVGKDVVENGKLDRRMLAQRIFADEQCRERVEAAVHPAVIRDFEQWKASQTSEIVMIESAIILLKPALAKVPDYILEVTAPDEVRVRRVMERDSSSEDAVRHRIEAQRDKPLRSADWTIETDDRHDVLPQIIDIIEQLKNGKDRS